ncbi:hypothetical protein HX869_01170, partial [Pseudomonas sp. P7779]|nr:hypothetical protein [Pseudomonas sp. P7779]
PPPPPPPVPPLPPAAEVAFDAAVEAAEKLVSPEHLAFLKQKDEAIEQLIESGSFSTTHFVISKLTKYIGHFDDSDAAKLFTAALENAQVGWIISDDDVYDFYVKLANEFLTAVEPELASQIVDLMGLVPAPPPPTPPAPPPPPSPLLI